MGRLSTEYRSASLGPGAYDLFLEKVDGIWRAYAASEDGEQLVEAAFVDLVRKPGAEDRPQLRLGSLYLTIKLFPFELTVEFK